MGDLAKIEKNLSKIMGGNTLISLDDEMFSEAIRLVMINGLVKMHEIIHDEESSRFEQIAAFKNVLATEKQFKTSFELAEEELDGEVELDNDELKIGG